MFNTTCLHVLDHKYPITEYFPNLLHDCLQGYPGYAWTVTNPQITIFFALWVHALPDHSCLSCAFCFSFCNNLINKLNHTHSPVHVTLTCSTVHASPPAHASVSLYLYETIIAEDTSTFQFYIWSHPPFLICSAKKLNSFPPYVRHWGN